MAEGYGRLAVGAIAGAALAAGIAAGWLGGRASYPPPPPPPTFLNPMRDAVKGETLVLFRASDRTTMTYRVLQADAGTLLLSIEDSAPGSPATTKELRVARACFGPFVILEGDVPPEYVENTVKEFHLQSASPENLRIDSLNRTFRCWKFVGEHRLHGTMTYWLSDEVPVHGMVRIATTKGVQWEIHGFGAPK